MQRSQPARAPPTRRCLVGIAVNQERKKNIMVRVHVFTQEQLSEEEEQALLNGPVERIPLPQGGTALYGQDTQEEIPREQTDAIANACMAGRITGYGLGQ